MTRLESYSTRLEVQQAERLRRLAQAYRIPAATILRAVLDRALDEWEDARTPAPPKSRNWLDPIDGEAT